MLKKRSAVFDAVINCLESDPSYSLSALTKIVGAGRHTIAKSVREAANQDFRAFRGCLKVRLACSLLAQKPDISVKEVSYTLGYRHPRGLRSIF
jgi:hypothetical protein